MSGIFSGIALYYGGDGFIRRPFDFIARSDAAWLQEVELMTPI